MMCFYFSGCLYPHCIIYCFCNTPPRCVSLLILQPCLFLCLLHCIFHPSASYVRRGAWNFGVCGILPGCILLGTVWDAWSSSVLVRFIWVTAGRGFRRFLDDFLAFLFRLCARVLVGASESLSSGCELAEFCIMSISRIGRGVGGFRFAGFAAKFLPALGVSRSGQACIWYCVH